MSQTLKRYSQISYSHDGIVLIDRVFVDPAATETDHQTEIEAKLAGINALFGVTNFTITTTYEYSVEFVDTTVPEVVEEVPVVVE